MNAHRWHDKKNTAKGFTLIELIIVLSILAILSLIGIASFAGYTKKQTVINATFDVVGLFQTAKFRTNSQVKPLACSGVFQGYSVVVTQAVSPNVGGTYVLNVKCGGVTTAVDGGAKTLPKNVLFSKSGTFSYSPFEGNVTGLSANPTTIGISHKDDATIVKTVSIYADGRITSN